MKRKSRNFCLSFSFLWVLAAAPAWAETTDKLLTTLQTSTQSYESVKDYTALFVKQERSEGKLDAPEEIFLKFEKPFKIYMKWLNPPKKGLEVHYERGRHDNKLVIRKPGFLTGLIGVIYLEQDSPWVRKGSESYDIEDAGIGTFLVDFDKAVRTAAQTGSLRSEWKDDFTVDATFDVPEENDTFFAKRCVVTFDPASKLPVKMELYDWEDQLTGIYDYRNLKTNVGSADEAFLGHIHRSLRRVWNHKE